jgi:hypothetical protein
VVRYRLKFVLQEFDLQPGVTTIGRSLDCHLTIEDPLVSRRHAQLVVYEDGVQLVDLGSRNGVRVNGAIVREPTMLRNGDRLRIGTQDLVFSRVEAANRHLGRTTGQLRLCAKCRQPYPREMVACPSCEATEQTDEDAVTASGSDAHNWTVQLFVEALERALRMGRVHDADALLRRAAVQVEELVQSRDAIDASALASLTLQALRTSIASASPAWSEWAIGIHRRSGIVPPPAVAELMIQVERLAPGAIVTAISELLARFSGAARLSGQDLQTLSMLRDFCASGAATAGENAGTGWPSS